MENYLEHTEQGSKLGGKLEQKIIFLAFLGPLFLCGPLTLCFFPHISLYWLIAGLSSFAFFLYFKAALKGTLAVFLFLAAALLFDGQMDLKSILLLASVSLGFLISSLSLRQIEALLFEERRIQSMPNLAAPVQAKEGVDTAFIEQKVQEAAHLVGRYKDLVAVTEEESLTLRKRCEEQMVELSIQLRENLRLKWENDLYKMKCADVGEKELREEISSLREQLSDARIQLHEAEISKKPVQKKLGWQDVKKAKK